MIRLCEEWAEVPVKTVHHRSYSICHVYINGMNNKSQLHLLMTLLVKAMGTVQTSVTTWPLQSSRCFELISLKLFMIVCVLVQEDIPNICSRITGYWQHKKKKNLISQHLNISSQLKYSPNANVP